MANIDTINAASLAFWSASMGLTLSFLIMGFLSVHSEGDPARTGTKWYKAASFLVLIWCIFGVATLAYLRSIYYGPDYGAIVPNYSEVRGQLAAFLDLFAQASIATLIAAQIHIAVGLQHATGAINHKSQMTRVHLAKTVALGVFALVMVLSIIKFGLYEWVLNDDMAEYTTDFVRAFGGISFIIQLVEVLFAILSMVLTLVKMRSSPLKMVNIQLVIANFLVFASTLYRVVISGMTMGRVMANKPAFFLPGWIDVVEAIFNPWFIATALVLCFNILKRTNYGLWTDRHHPSYV